MAISQCMVTSFKAEILGGVQDLDTDVIKIALYTSAATIDNSTTVYSATNEVSGAGYTAGGKTLTCTVTLSGNYAILDFADISWTTASFTSRGALVYNSSKANKSIFVLDFGTDKSSSNGTFTIQFPVADATNAIIRIA